jgi:hypothetical protein
MLPGPCDHLAMGWLRRLLLGKAGRPAALITGVVGHEDDGGWSVFFISEGLEPAKGPGMDSHGSHRGRVGRGGDPLRGAPTSRRRRVTVCHLPLERRWRGDLRHRWPARVIQRAGHSRKRPRRARCHAGRSGDGGRTDAGSASERRDVSMDPPHRIAPHSSDFTAVRMRRRLHSGQLLKQALVVEAAPMVEVTVVPVIPLALSDAMKTRHVGRVLDRRAGRRGKAAVVGRPRSSASPAAPKPSASRAIAAAGKRAVSPG